MPRNPKKTQSLKKLTEGLKFGYTGCQNVKNHPNIILELKQFLWSRCKISLHDSYVDRGTKVPAEKMSAIELKTLHHDIFEFYQLVSPLHTCHPPGNPNAPNSLPMIPTQ